MAEISVDTAWARSARAGIPLRAVGDDRLARMAARGDRRAFAEIYRRYHQSLYRYCHSILRSSDDAQDALQNTMTSVMRALEGEDRSIALKPWLYRIAHNESIDLLRRRRPEVDLEAASDIAAPGADAATRERLRLLLEDLAELPEKQRAALVMRELNGLEYTEIGDAFGISAAAATQTVYDARRGLQELSEGRDLDCDDVQVLLSQNDGRLLKSRKVRGHMRTCVVCQEFQTAMARRSRDLAALFPVLPAPVAASLLHGLFGGGGGGTSGGIGGGLATGIKAGGASISLKSFAVATVVATAGTGAAVEFDALTAPASQASNPPARASVAPSSGGISASAQGPAFSTPLARAATPLERIDMLDKPGRTPVRLPALGRDPAAAPTPSAGDVAGVSSETLASVPELEQRSGSGTAPEPESAPPAAADDAPAQEETGGNGNGNGNGNANGQGNGQGQGNGNGNANGQGNGQGQGNGNGNANGQGNGNANGQGNGNANGQGNGNANGQGNGNGNANGQGNGNANGQANGNANGQANGNANGQANGNANGQANGNASGQANGNGNGNANGNGQGNGNGRGNSGKKPDEQPGA